MSRRNKTIGLLAAVTCLIMALAIAVLGSRKPPRFGGRTIEEWAYQLQSARIAERDTARRTLESIGPDATAELIRLLRTRDFPYEAEYGRMRLRFPRLFSLLPSNRSAFMLRNTVMKILENRPHEELLEHLDEIALLLASDEPDVRTRAAKLISRLGTDAHAAIPDLAAAIHEDSSFSMVVHAIGRVGMPYATNAFPALKAALGFDSLPHRITAATTLAFMAKETPGLPEALADILEQGSDTQKEYAVHGLLMLSWRAMDVLPRIEAEAHRSHTPRTREKIEKLAESIRRSHQARDEATQTADKP